MEISGIPVYSIITLCTETVITVCLLYVIYTAYTTGRLVRWLLGSILTFETLFNISYMASRIMTHVDPPDHVDSAFHIGVAIFHGIFALTMFIALLVFMFFAWRAYARGENYFKNHNNLTYIFICAWLVALFSGFLFFYEAYFSPEEVHHRTLEAIQNGGNIDID